MEYEHIKRKPIMKEEETETLEDWLVPEPMLFNNHYTVNPVTGPPSDKSVIVESLAQLCTSISIADLERAAKEVLPKAIEDVNMKQFLRDLLRIIVDLLSSKIPDAVCYTLDSMHTCIPLLVDCGLYVHPGRGVVNFMCLSMIRHPMEDVRLKAYDFTAKFFRWPFVTPAEKSLALQRLMEHASLPDMTQKCRQRVAELLIQGCEVALPTVAPQVMEVAKDVARESMYSVRRMAPQALVRAATLAEDQATAAAQVIDVFKELCEDSVWMVRQSAAEHLGPLSQLLVALEQQQQQQQEQHDEESQEQQRAKYEQHRQELVKLVQQLVKDEERWVRSAALASLGVVIASFVPPPPSEDLGPLDAEYWLPKHILQPRPIVYGKGTPRTGMVEGQGPYAQFHVGFTTECPRSSFANARMRNAEYGKRLPWVPVENHPRAMRGLQRPRVEAADAGTLMPPFVPNSDAEGVETLAGAMPEEVRHIYTRELEALQQLGPIEPELLAGDAGPEEAQEKNKGKVLEQQQQPQAVEAGGGVCHDGDGDAKTQMRAQQQEDAEADDGSSADEALSSSLSSALSSLGSSNGDTRDAASASSSASTGRLAATPVPQEQPMQTGLVMPGDDDDGAALDGPSFDDGPMQSAEGEDDYASGTTSTTSTEGSAPVIIQPSHSAQQQAGSAEDKAREKTVTSAKNQSFTKQKAKQQDKTQTSGDDEEDEVKDAAEDELLAKKLQEEEAKKQAGSGDTSFVEEFHNDMLMQKQLLRWKDIVDGHSTRRSMKRPRCSGSSACPVPEDLIVLFSGMAEEEANEQSPELAPLCAFSIAAVTWALGEDHFHRIADVPAKLGMSNDWNVRSTLAACIHDMARIIGRNATEQHLVPVYRDLMRDWTQSKEALLPHVTNFFGVLSPSARMQLLPLVPDLVENNIGQWRGRCLLADQLVYLCQMFPAEVVTAVLVPVVHRLLRDKVAAVRITATRPAGMVAWRYVEDKATADLNAFLSATRSRLSDSQAFTDRIVFLEFFAQVAPYCEYKHLECIAGCLPQLMKDKVANVRLRAVRVVDDLNPDNYLRTWPRDVKQGLWSAIESLANDPDEDRDVRETAQVTLRRKRAIKDLIG